MSKIGHNEPPQDAATMIASFIARFQRIDAKISELNDDKKELRAEVKASGLDTKQIATVLGELKFIEEKGRAAFNEKQETLDLYRRAGGVILGGDE